MLKRVSASLLPTDTMTSVSCCTGNAGQKHAGYSWTRHEHEGSPRVFGPGLSLLLAVRWGSHQQTAARIQVLSHVTGELAIDYSYRQVAALTQH